MDLGGQTTGLLGPNGGNERRGGGNGAIHDDLAGDVLVV